MGLARSRNGRSRGIVRRWLGRAAAAALSFAAMAGAPVAAAEFDLAPGQRAIGEVANYVIRHGDVFPDVARHFDVGYTALAAANPGADPWVPGEGRGIKIPSLFVMPDAPQRGIVINLGQYMLYYYPLGGDRVFAYPIGIGVIGWKTPLGATRVVRKEANPVWYPPPSIRAQRPELPAVFPAGPDNPLGAFALYLGWPNYLVHGTNKPDGVGRNVSHGCIHLYPEDISQLFAMVPPGTPVIVVNQPATVGWKGDRLYLAVFPSQAQTEEIDTEHSITPDPAQGVRELARAAAAEYADLVDWNAVDGAATERTGMAVLIADRSAYVGSAARPARPNAAAPTEFDRVPAAGRPEPVDDAQAEQGFDRLEQEVEHSERAYEREMQNPDDRERWEPADRNLER